MFLPLRGGESTLYRGSCDGLAPVLLATAKDASLASLEPLELNLSASAPALRRCKRSANHRSALISS
jgi:hypothetical protein